MPCSLSSLNFKDFFFVFAMAAVRAMMHSRSTASPANDARTTFPLLKRIKSISSAWCMHKPIAKLQRFEECFRLTNQMISCQATRYLLRKAGEYIPILGLLLRWCTLCVLSVLIYLARPPHRCCSTPGDTLPPRMIRYDPYLTNPLSFTPFHIVNRFLLDFLGILLRLF